MSERDEMVVPLDKQVSAALAAEMRRYANPLAAIVQAAIDERPPLQRSRPARDEKPRRYANIDGRSVAVLSNSTKNKRKVRKLMIYAESNHMKWLRRFKRLADLAVTACVDPTDKNRNAVLKFLKRMA